MDECRPLPSDSTRTVESKAPTARGLHSFTSQLNVSAFYGIGGAWGGFVACVKGVFRVVRVFCVCQARLKLSSKVNECKPLPTARKRLRSCPSGTGPMCRGSHSSTFRLNLSAFCGIGGTFRGCLGVCRVC